MLPVAGGGRGRGHEILLAGAGERRHYPRGFCPLPFLEDKLYIKIIALDAIYNFVVEKFLN
jgi:hypothetical protein